jgi:transposase
MYFVGIDIGKRYHEAGIVDAQGQRHGKSLRFANSQAGAHKLLKRLRAVDPNLGAVAVAMEATGHYWYALYAFLTKAGVPCHVINPLQSDALRNLYVRQTKTDTQDAFLIAEVLRFGPCRPTPLADETLIALRQLSRFRFHLVDTLADAKRRALALLDQVFPEYDQYFSDVFGKASSALLHTYATPDEIAATDVHALAELLLAASHQRVGLETARAIHEAAQDSFGITQALDVYRMQLRMLLDQIAFLQDQIAEVEADIRRRVDSLDHHLVTIPGIGPVLAAAILGEIGDITRFASAQRLVAFAGIDPTVKQSGQYMASRTRMSKRGSPYLRRALWLAANTARTCDPSLRAFYQRKRAERKHAMCATGAVARKLTHVIYAILRDQVPYQSTAIGQGG